MSKNKVLSAKHFEFARRGLSEMAKTVMVAGTYYSLRRDIIRTCCKVGQRVVLRCDHPHGLDAIAVLVKVCRMFLWGQYKQI